MYDKEEHKLPGRLEFAAKEIAEWFASRNIRNWQYGGIEVREYDPEWYEYGPGSYTPRYKQFGVWGSIAERTATWAENEMLKHAEPLLVLERFAHGKPLPKKDEEFVTFRRAIPYHDNV